ncbi:MAG: TrkA family potassium uptake protein [Oscillospiraceae bacterium]|jgi:trk system potassium uptake protein TrkA|nr:TrkA family potassium uptake protein [Oscillospiraceae bacterium]
MKIMLVGGHYKTHFLTKLLLGRKHEVVIINEDLDWCRFLTNAHSVLCVCGDGTKPFILEDANAADMDAVVALTNKDAENLVICELAKKLFHVQSTLAIVNDPKNLTVFVRLGVDKCISATEMLAEVIESETLFNEVRNYLPLENGRLVCLDIELRPHAAVNGQALRDITLPRDCIVSCVLRGDELIIPNGDTVLQSGDKLIVMAADVAADRAAEFFAGTAR